MEQCGELCNQINIIRSCDYQPTKQQYDSLHARQEAVLAKLSPTVLLRQLTTATAAAEQSSDEMVQQLLRGDVQVGFQRGGEVVSSPWRDGRARTTEASCRVECAPKGARCAPSIWVETTRDLRRAGGGVFGAVRAAARAVPYARDEDRRRAPAAGPT
jgi:hypothetical protein